MLRGRTGTYLGVVRVHTQGLYGYMLRGHTGTCLVLYGYIVRSHTCTCLVSYGYMVKCVSNFSIPVYASTILIYVHYLRSISNQ